MRIMVFMKEDSLSRSGSRSLTKPSPRLARVQRVFSSLFLGLAFVFLAAFAQPAAAASEGKTTAADSAKHATFVAVFRSPANAEALCPLIGVAVAVALTHLLQRRRTAQVRASRSTEN